MFTSVCQTRLTFAINYKTLIGPASRSHGALYSLTSSCFPTPKGIRESHALLLYSHLKTSWTVARSHSLLPLALRQRSTAELISHFHSIQKDLSNPTFLYVFMCGWEEQGVLNGGTKEPKTTFSPLSSCGTLRKAKYLE